MVVEIVFFFSVYIKVVELEFIFKLFLCFYFFVVF